MKRSVQGVAPLQYHAAGRAASHQVAGNGTGVVLALLVLLLCSGCEAKLPLKRYLLEVEDQQLNATITSDNVCLKNIVEQKQVVYYNLDVSDCLEDETFGYNYLEVEARIFQQCADSHEWSVLVNTEGVLIPIEGARESSNGTFVDFIGAEHHQYYGHLDIPLDRLGSKPIVGFYSSCGPVQYTLKAWCSQTKGCNLSCSDPDTGPCISLENCRCTRGIDEDEDCIIDVEDLPDEEDLVTRYGLTQTHNGDTLRYGTWKYFRFQAFNNASRILVELSRAYGDVILFVKQEDSEDGGPTSESLPSEQDAYKYADLVGFQNRLSNHHRFINGSGNFYIGVYNTDRCLEEDTIFNLTITIATPTAPLNLCPLNCSYPQGQCVRDNVCDCEPGYGGRYCSGSVFKGAARRTYNGLLQPGEWAYINMTVDDLTDNGIIAVQFNSTTGHPVLLAQENRLPMLTDFTLKFSNSTLGATPSDTYHINTASLSSGQLILGVFNVDYAHRGVSEFHIRLIGTRNGLSIWVILVVALGSSIFLLSLIATVRQVSQRRGQAVPESWGLDFEAVPQDLEMVQRHDRDRVLVSTLPLLAYYQGMVPQEDDGCSICLNSYRTAEIVCRLPGCKHIFHIRCLEEWFQTDDSCPLCRVPLRDQINLSSPEAVSPDLRPPTHSVNSSSMQTPGEGLDNQTASSSSSSHKIVEGHSEKPASKTTKDDGPLLSRGDSNSLGSSSNSEGGSSDSESRLNGTHSEEAANKAACIVSPSVS
ncbi:hypothetical protein KC19_7G093100 [Ceratodon purpureus]|uniref:RING-type domain-containing protein n=1 Tax=Ceratodon purpureus TaxID=3225 RepID=A0A8T0H9B3_CERPU|nr:hypothetical protein KC19_7G093100 [Ceratodon purpureus]